MPKGRTYIPEKFRVLLLQRSFLGFHGLGQVEISLAGSRSSCNIWSLLPLRKSHNTGRVAPDFGGNICLIWLCCYYPRPIYWVIWKASNFESCLEKESCWIGGPGPPNRCPFTRRQGFCKMASYSCCVTNYPKLRFFKPNLYYHLLECCGLSGLSSVFVVQGLSCSLSGVCWTAVIWWLSWVWCLLWLPC